LRRALAVHPRASLCFYWAPIGRQVWTRDPARLDVRERFERDGDSWRQSLLFP
jgi:pyridoxine/pyridoxamine 5'-phosphate oxidase